jgi:hypothetical protein
MLRPGDGTDETAGVDRFMLEIVATMTEELGQRPSVTEVVDVVMQSLPIGDDRLDLRLFPRQAMAIGEDDKPIERRGSRVGELNDAAFVSAAQMVSMQLQRRAGRDRRLPEMGCAPGEQAEAGLVGAADPGSADTRFHDLGPGVFAPVGNGLFVAVDRAAGRAL